MISRKINSFLNPENYQGFYRKKNYFEGWYFKVISQCLQKSFAFIPGVSMDKNGKKKAFIMVLLGNKKRAEHYDFDFEEFKSDKNKLNVSIRDNSFSKESLYLNLESIKCNLSFDNHFFYPKKFYSPSVMGPFAYVPFMECNHAVISMLHRVNGSIEVLGEKFDIVNGRGYLEKDWGASFPSSYIWIQCNNFKTESLSIMVSVAKVPVYGLKIKGFIIVVMYEGEFIKFATYNRSKVTRCFVNKDIIEVNCSSKKYSIEITAKKSEGTNLAAPILGGMSHSIKECLSSTVKIKLFKNGKLILEDKGTNAGAEFSGIIEEIGS